MRSFTFGTTLVAAMLALTPASAYAQQDDHGTEMQQRGLGQSNPSATDLSIHPDWKVYAFRRDGIAYYQVNDLNGNVHVIIGNADGVFWALPVGERAAQTSLPSWRLKIPSTWGGVDVYVGQEFTLARFGKGNEAVWSVETPFDPS